MQLKALLATFALVLLCLPARGQVAISGLDQPANSSAVSTDWRLEAADPGVKSWGLRLDSLFEALAGSMAKLEAIVNAQIIDSTEIDTEAELEGLFQGSVNMLVQTELDASSELAGLLGDETGSGVSVFGTSPTIATPALTLEVGTVPTAEGKIQWDGTNDVLKIGDGADTDSFYRVTWVAGNLCFFDETQNEVECSTNTVAELEAIVTDINAGTDISADLEEESHGSEHLFGGADAVNADGLPTSCGNGTFPEALNGTFTCTDVIEEGELASVANLETQLGDVNAGTDISADLEEEAHASEHQDGGADEVAVTAGMMNAGTGATASTFWRGDNTWATPAGSGGDITDVFSCSTGDCAAVTVENGESLGASGTGTITATAVPASGISGTDAGTDLTADLEEEAHASEHYAAGADVLNVDDLASGAGGSGEIFISQGVGVAVAAQAMSGDATINSSGVVDITESVLQENGADEITGESLGTACSDTEPMQANATGGVDCGVGYDPGSISMVDGGANPDTVRTDASASRNFTLTFDEADNWFENPTNLEAGGWYSWRVTNFAGTASQPTYDSYFDSAPLIRTASGEITVLTCFAPSTSSLTCASNVEQIEWAVAASDESTALTTGTGKVTFRMPFAMQVEEVRASVGTAPTTSGTLTVDINEGGTTILSTKLTIDTTEKTSESAATPAVISDSEIADDAEITVDIDAISGGATEAGLKILLKGIRK